MRRKGGYYFRELKGIDEKAIELLLVNVRVRTRKVIGQGSCCVLRPHDFMHDAVLRVVGQYYIAEEKRAAGTGSHASGRGLGITAKSGKTGKGRNDYQSKTPAINLTASSHQSYTPARNKQQGQGSVHCSLNVPVGRYKTLDN